VRLRRTGASNVDIQDRRGQGGGFPGGAAIGGGIGGIGALIVALLLGTGQCMSGGGQGAGGLGIPGLDEALGGGQSGGAPGVACDTETAKIVCDATTSVQDFWTDELPRALNQQYQRTQTVFFSGATQTGCGQASSQTGPFYCPADSLVYFDLDFLDQLQSQFGAQGDFATAYIAAHEYGHHVQNLLGISRQVSQAEQQQPSRANEFSIRLELQADCLAGVWGASVKDLLDRGDLEEGLGAASAVGDDRIQIATQGRTDPETWNHGTSEDRVRWFRAGFDSGDPRSCDTFATDAVITSIG
jgi:uncharacterized protein